MPPDLDTRIRNYARIIEAEAPPVGAEEAVARATAASTEQLRRQEPSRARRSWVVGLAAAITTCVAIGLPVLLLSGELGSSPLTSAPGLIAGTGWERGPFAPGVIVEDLAATSFGLAAAAGTDGVWVSPDGIAWRQSLVGPYEPPTEPAATPAPPLTTPPAEPVVSSDVGALLEFDGSLYAFGKVWVAGEPSDPQLPRDTATVVWESDDGLTWDLKTVGPFPQLIDAVAADDAIYLFGREVFGGGQSPQFSTPVLRSTDGVAWDPVATRGLEDTVLWAVVYHEDAFIALGTRYDTDELRLAAEEGRIPDGSEQSLVFTSTDAATWAEAGEWTISPLSLSAWPRVDLFPSPYGIVAVGIIEGLAPGPGAAQVFVALSTDGKTFSVLDPSDPALSLADTRDGGVLPPLTPPEGAVFNGQIIMLGCSYPEASDEPSYHRWVTSVDALAAATATGL